MGPFCCPDLSVTRQARPAGASCAAFDPLLLYQAARLLLFSYPKAVFVRLYYCSPFLSTTAYYSMAAGCASFGGTGARLRRGAHLRTSKKHRTNHYPAS